MTSLPVIQHMVGRSEWSVGLSEQHRQWKASYGPGRWIDLHCTSHASLRSWNNPPVQLERVSIAWKDSSVTSWEEFCGGRVKQFTAGKYRAVCLSGPLTATCVSHLWSWTPFCTSCYPSLPSTSSPSSLHYSTSIHHSSLRLSTHLPCLFLLQIFIW